MVVRKARFYCILRDRWKNLRDCFGLSKHLKNTPPDIANVAV